MTSKNLSNNSQHGGDLKQYHWLGLMSFALLTIFMVIPVCMEILEVLERNTDMGRKNLQDLLLYNGILQWVLMLLPFVTGITMFKYLNSRAEVDFYHSLPITSKKIFLSRYFMGILYFVVPLFLCGFLTYGIGIVAGFGSVPTLPEFLWKWLEYTAGYISCYSVVCLGVILTGNHFMAICTSLGFVATPSALVFFYNMLGSAFFYTFVSNSLFSYGVGQFTNPYFNLLRYLYLSPYYIAEQEGSTFWHYLLQIVVFFPLCSICFEKRPSENSSNPVAIEIFKPIIKSLGVICGAFIGGIFFMETINNSVLFFLVGAFLWGACLHIAFECLFEMDIKAGLKNKKHFVGLYSVVALVGIVFSLDITGYDTRIEPLENIATIEWNGFDLKEEKNKEIVYGMMEDCIVNGNRLVGYDSHGRVKVTLTNGSSYERQYNNTNLDSEDYLAIFTSREYLLQSHYYNLTEEELTAMEENYINITEVNDSAWNSSPIMILYQQGERTVDEYLSWEIFLAVYESLIQDLDVLTPEYLNENIPILKIDYFDYSSRIFYNIPIYEIHQEALALLQLPTLEKVTVEKASSYLLQMGEDTNNTVPLTDYTMVQQENILSEMTPIYVYNVGVSWETTLKNTVNLLSDGMVIGYLSQSDFEEIEKEET